MNLPPKAAKIHLGVVTGDKSVETSLKEALDQLGGGYVHAGKSMLELHQRMGMQKIQLIVCAPSTEEDLGQVQATVQFFRSKRDSAEVPICILVAKEKVTMARLLKDPLTRGFSTFGGLFLPLLAMRPLIDKVPGQSGTLERSWIDREFLESLQAKIGQTSAFTVDEATDDDIHAGFFCQTSDEVRTHLGWFKFAARFQDTAEDGMKGLFPGLSQELIEETAEVLLTSIVQDFKNKVELDLSARGAIFFPPIDQFSPADRKLVQAGSKSSAVLFRSSSCCILLELIQLI